MRIAITGPSGSGKTSLAAELARTYPIWPALKAAFANRRELPRRYAHLRIERLRSDREVRAFVDREAGRQAAARLS